MGLKTGSAGIAAQRNLFVCLNTADGHPYYLAQVTMSPTGGFQLVYPDGSVGLLRRGSNSQLELAGIVPNGDPTWKPTGEQRLAQLEQLPKERILFEGTYTMGNRPDSDFPPSPLYVNDEERFKTPHGPWEEVVASRLENGPTPLIVRSD
jgi:hypothetical protein